ncbi:dual specificity protein phosphatase or MAP kinase phosphatase [Tritrichomonas foetus]|uniref:Dual specificity protein phosphatase or MAP kinase phosphatase n=1 Tax=Tritrichomonas foetus TaxID=1144522 RepID=A0A1J4JTT7_9EUKA|nr:dual specificity protein phosphatase or MAP kinase phosphatase [Tritrichomonas foetus]|eukprot:OHT02535.1 dual specificity protein phosphatase or MAP kinase phosphatase [Tritrichomonas foetus]
MNPLALNNVSGDSNQSNNFSKTTPIKPRRLMCHQTIQTKLSLNSNSENVKSADTNLIKKIRNSNECDMVVPGLFIGGEKAARNKKLLRKLHVTHIVNLNSNETMSDDNDRELNDSLDGIDGDESDDSEKGSPQIISRFNVNLTDSVFQDLNDDFWNSLEFVRNAVNSGGTVLAHCRRGISRSAALCVAYLMEDKGMSFEDALDLLKEKRPSVDINQGFADQLRARKV